MEKIDYCQKCRQPYWNIGEYIECIRCWYDRVFKNKRLVN